MRVMYQAKGYNIASCPSCGFAQVLEQPDATYLDSLYAKLHTKHLAFRDSSAARKENLRRLDLVRKLVPRDALVLDAGCATGDFLVEANEYFTMYGVDVSSQAIEVAAARNPSMAGRLRATRLEMVGTEWPSFDAICLWDVIEHLWDPVRVCQELMRMLKPGGFLFLSTPDMASLAARTMKSRWAFMIPPYHLSFFSGASFKHLFTRRMPGTIVMMKTKGKWTNLAFLLYKLNQMSERLVPNRILEYAAQQPWLKLNIYVPTNDILYVAVQKPIGGR